jgi:RNA polymerase sigma-70 factor, ECF subfamily
MARVDRFGGEFEAVLSAARRGAPWAHERIFTTLAPLVTAYLQVQGASEPDDLTSDVFMAVLSHLHTFTGGEAGFRSWVFTIAHRRMLDEWRRVARRPLTEPLVDTIQPVAPDNVESAVERSFAVHEIRALCQRLAPDQREVLLLRLLAGLTVDEIAAKLGKSRGAVKALQRRAYQAIGRLLERENVSL